MSGLNNISLPATILATMYKDTLIVPDIPEENGSEPQQVKMEEQKEPVISSSVDAKWYLGDNARNIVIVVKDEQNVYLDDSMLQLLGNILNACKFSLADVAIVNHLRTPLNYKQMKEKTGMNYLLLFDVPTGEMDLPFTIPAYQPHVYNGLSILYTPSLSVMLGNTEDAKLEKSKLWICLKKIFQL